MGGSGAWALLNGENGVESELNLGVGWQDPAVIRESGLCVWRSGKLPVLHFKRAGEMLAGKMAILWTNIEHDTPSNCDLERDYDLIEKASQIAMKAVLENDFEKLCEAVAVSYKVQLGEKMAPLCEIAGAKAHKYCGGGHGGYALYLFSDSADRDAAVAAEAKCRPIEPFCQ